MIVTAIEHDYHCRVRGLYPAGGVGGSHCAHPYSKMEVLHRISRTSTRGLRALTKGLK